ncbi:thioredoxin [bacterium]|nr:thioredoxin [bacterium]
MSVIDAPVHVTDASFETDILKSDVPVLVDFWAPWCAPCRMIAPSLEQLAKDYAGKVKVAKVNTDENSARAGALGIRGIPTLIMFKDGKEIDRVVGAVPKQMLQQMVDKNLG